MAHMAKIKGNIYGLMVIHNDREKEDPTLEREHNNPNIDADKTHLNYDLINRENSYQYVKDRLEKLDEEREKQTGQHLRKDAVKLCSLIVYLPEDREQAGERYERQFFQGCVDYCREMFGEENVVQAIVHKDENRTHIHILNIPVTNEPDRQGRVYDRISYKDAFTREDYRNMHPLLQEHCRQRTHDRSLVLYDEERAKRKTVDKETYIKEQEEKREREYLKEQERKDRELLEKAKGEQGKIKRGVLGTVSKEEIDRYEGLMSKVVVAADREIKRAEAERDKAIYEKDNCYSLRELELNSRLQEVARENKQLERQSKAYEKDHKILEYMRENYNVEKIEKEYERQEKEHERTHQKEHER